MLPGYKEKTLLNTICLTSRESKVLLKGRILEEIGNRLTLAFTRFPRFRVTRCKVEMLVVAFLSLLINCITFFPSSIFFRKNSWEERGKIFMIQRFFSSP